MRAKQQTIEGPEQTRTGCCHYWVIETGNGATSAGICVFCGETREFKNSLIVRTEVGGVKAVDDGRDRAMKNGRNGGKNGAQEKRPRYTIEDYRRWGKMGGRGHKKNRDR